LVPSHLNQASGASRASGSHGRLYQPHGIFALLFQSQNTLQRKKRRLKLLNSLLEDFPDRKLCKIFRFHLPRAVFVFQILLVALPLRFVVKTGMAENIVALAEFGGKRLVAAVSGGVRPRTAGSRAEDHPLGHQRRSQSCPRAKTSDSRYASLALSSCAGAAADLSCWLECPARTAGQHTLASSSLNASLSLAVSA